MVIGQGGFSTAARAEDEAPAKGAAQAVTPLREAFKGKFLIGAALDLWGGKDSLEVALATKHFSAFTPENSMKPASVQPAEGRFTFDGADRLVALAEKCGATPIGHCLVWHSQTPRWFFQGPDDKPAGRDLALARMRKHIATVVGRYKGRVKQWDVVNEALSDTPGEFLRSSPWLKAVGDDYIAEAFRAAHAADPGAVLIYNDYGIERGSKRAKALKLLKALLDQKVPVHAVGIQCHWRMDGPDLAEVEESIKQFAGLGLKVMITELDIGVLPGRSRGPNDRTPVNPYPDGLPDAVARKLAERYGKAFELFLRHRDVIGRVTLWGTHDGRSWLNHFPVRGRTDHPLLFDRRGQPKAAFFAVLKAAREVPTAAPTTWTADNGNGTFSNPLFFDEFSDPDLIRVGDEYYLTGTTMHTFPGLPILRSRDLVNWELVSYACDRLDLGPEFRLENGKTVYGQGIWAPSFRHHNGTFYLFTNVNRHQTQLFTATNPAGPWKHTRMKRAFHDLSVLFDDDGKVYVIWGYQEIRLAQLNERLDDIVPGSERVIIPKAAGMGEGSHFYKIDGKYYITSAWFAGPMRMPCARADKPEGPYQVNRAISAGETFGVAAGAMHQGGIVRTPAGEWWGFSMMDYNAVGRLTCLSPVTWHDGWPYFGLPGNLGRTPRIWKKPATSHPSPPSAPYQRSDTFRGPRLANAWQWNHVPVDGQWSLTARPGFLRLRSLPAADFWTARNTLTQRAVGPHSAATVELDPRGLKAGDVAGLGLLNAPYAWIGVRPAADGVRVECYDKRSEKSVYLQLPAGLVWLRADCDFQTQTARFSCSTDGKTFQALGEPFKLVFQLRTFQGVRFALFHYNTGGKPGGDADFTRFTLHEPYPRGLTRPIPDGQVIQLRTGGGGTVLAIKGDTLAGVPANDPLAATAAVRFKVLARPLGRVVLQCMADNRVIGVTGRGAESRVVLGPPRDDDTQSFQWTEMPNGDLYFLSVTGHRHLRIRPDGTVSADAPGADRQRPNGASFAWEVAK
ncbi:MAG: endo-1,4-beta-xylanase [Gemmataceae bacterium]